MDPNDARPNEHDVSRRHAMRTGGAVAAGAALAPMVRPRAVHAGQSSQKVRIGVVGGGFGSMFQWHEHADCVVQAVSDLRDDRREKLMKVYGCQKSYPSLEQLILDKSVDAVAVFTGAPDHVRHVIACLQAGKHVICAVPAAVTLEEAEQLLSAVKRTGLTYMMAETSYYYQAAITARKWHREGAFGTVFYAEAEYHHASPQYPRKGSLQIDKNGARTWRYGYPPMLYPTHSTSLLIGTTGERLVSVSCLGWEYGMDGLKNNTYENPFRNATAFFKTSRGHGFRVSEFRYGAIPLTVNAKWYGTKKSFLMRIRGVRDQDVTLDSRDRTAEDDAGFAFQEAVIEDHDPTQWWKTDMLPKPLRHNRGGHDGSHPFITHEFIDALVHGRRPTVDVYEALAYTVPGIIAHQSALRGGQQLEIPQLT